MLQPTPEQLLHQLLLSLEDHLPEAAGSPEVIRRCLDIALSHHKMLQEYLRTAGFESKKAEVCFFREIKPEFDGRVIFFNWLLRIASLQPAGGNDVRIPYYRQLTTAISNHYRQHADLRIYIQSGMTHFDELYFTRPTSALVLVDASPDYLLSDPLLNAPRSKAMATLIACRLMEDYISQQPGSANNGAQPTISTALTWTGSKAALTELIYALQEFGVFNNSKPEIKKVADYFAMVFNINIGNVYKIYEDNRLRKKNRTPFLDNLRNALIRRMELDDEHAL